MVWWQWQCTVISSFPGGLCTSTLGRRYWLEHSAVIIQLFRSWTTQLTAHWSSSPGKQPSTMTHWDGWKHNHLSKLCNETYFSSWLFYFKTIVHVHKMQSTVRQRQPTRIRPKHQRLDNHSMVIWNVFVFLISHQKVLYSLWSWLKLKKNYFLSPTNC